MALLLRILAVLCLVEMQNASGISEIERRDREIEKQPECLWSHFGFRINSLKTDLQVLTHKMDTLMEKMDTQTSKMDSQMQRVDALSGKMDAQMQRVDALTNKMDAQTQKVDRALDRKECPPGFNYLPEIDQCLRLNTDKMPWAQAHATCRGMAQGGQLVTITSSAKQDAVRRYLERQFAKPETAVCVISQWTPGGKLVWISGQRQISNRCDTPFVWKFKGIDVSFTFTKWLNGQPDCGGNSEHCAQIAGGLDYSWNDIPCAWSLCSVCEI